MWIAVKAEDQQRHGSASATAHGRTGCPPARHYWLLKGVVPRVDVTPAAFAARGEAAAADRIQFLVRERPPNGESEHAYGLAYFGFFVHGVLPIGASYEALDAKHGSDARSS